MVMVWKLTRNCSLLLLRHDPIRSKTGERNAAWQHGSMVMERL
jgi:hypothetical protein